MTKHEPPNSTNPSEIEALIARFEDGQLGVEDRRLISRLLRLLLTLIRVVEQKNTSISRLKRMLFGPGSDKRPVLTPLNNTPTKDEPPATDVPPPRPPDVGASLNAESAPSRRGHGRRGAAAYTGAKRVVCIDPELAPGALVSIEPVSRSSL